MPGSKLPLSAADGSDVTELVRLVYDMAVNSMDYGSGFLSTEEYDALASLADILDAKDRLDVHGKANEARFPHGVNAPVHRFEPDRESLYPEDVLCKVCGRSERYGQHEALEVTDDAG